MEQKTFRAGFIVIVGRSNVGKSTLMNALVGEKVAIVSDRAQTTRSLVRGILTEADRQIVFVDTPGMHRPRTRLGEYMMYATQQAMLGVDGAMAVFDADEPFLAGDKAVLDKLIQEGLPTVAVLNKIDRVEKPKLLEWMQRLSAYSIITDIVPVSALKQQNLDDLKDTLTQLLPEGDMLFDPDYYTDQPERVLVAELIREKALLALREEIPHGIGVEVLEMRTDADGVCNISANILCERDSHKGVIIGKQGSMLQRIGTQARKDIRAMLGQGVYLQLWVKVKQNWRDNPTVMRDLGYDKRDLVQ